MNDASGPADGARRATEPGPRRQQARPDALRRPPRPCAGSCGRANPHLTVAGAAGAVPAGGTLRVLTGDYAETMVLSNPMEVRDYGGAAVIGAGAAPAAASSADRDAPPIEGDGANRAAHANAPQATATKAER